MNETHLAYLVSEDWRERLNSDLLPWIERVADLGSDVLEVGPGPGLTTDILRERAARVTAIEIDRSLAAPLSARLAGSNVDVIEGSAAQMPFATGRFSAVTAFSMLHHVPTPELQDVILREICRVLQPGRSFFASDARDVEPIRAGHHDDTFVPLPLDRLAERLTAAGFEDVSLEIGDYEIRFAARKPGQSQAE